MIKEYCDICGNKAKNKEVLSTKTQRQWECGKDKEIYMSRVRKYIGCIC